MAQRSDVIQGISLLCNGQVFGKFVPSRNS